MARILYGVAGEGMGHAIRSKVIIEHLLKKHELIIVSSRKPYEFLSKRFKEVYDIHGLHINYKNNKVQSIKTLLHNAYNLPKGSYKTLRKLMKIIKDFKPEIVISDFEPFTGLVSKFFDTKLISIDNMHIMTNCKFKIPKRYYKDYLAAKIVINSFIIKADYYLINTFFYPEIRKKNTFLFPPILRDEILKANFESPSITLWLAENGQVLQGEEAVQVMRIYFAAEEAVLLKKLSDANGAEESASDDDEIRERVVKLREEQKTLVSHFRGLMLKTCYETTSPDSLGTDFKSTFRLF